MRTLMDHQMLPEWDSLLYPSAAEGYSVIYSDEHDSLPTLMRLYADSFSVAAQIGFLGARLRREKHTVPGSEFHPQTQEMAELRRALSRLWEASDVAYWSQHRDSLPRRSREILQQVSPPPSPYLSSPFLLSFAPFSALLPILVASANVDMMNFP